MSTILKEGLLCIRNSPFLQTVRFRRVNVQRPRAPHYERARALALLKPEYVPDLTSLKLRPPFNCRVVEENERFKQRPDNPYEKILARELFETFENNRMIALLHLNSLPNDELREHKLKFKRKNMEMMFHSKHTVKLAVEGTKYQEILKLFVCHTAIVVSKDPQVPAVFKILSKCPYFILMSAVVDGRLLSVSQLEVYKQLKDLTTARVQLLTTLNSAGADLLGKLNQSQSALVRQLDYLADESGEKK